MTYNKIENEVLLLMERTNFKNISKNEVITIVSKLEELAPSVARDIIEKFPELVDLIKNSLDEYKVMLEAIIASDDRSIQNFYEIANKELDNAKENRKQLYECAKALLDNCNKVLDNPNLTAEEVSGILKYQVELFMLIDEIDCKIREHEKETAEMVCKKDSEKRLFNWKLASGITFGMIVLVGGGSSLLSGGKIDIKSLKK